VKIFGSAVASPNHSTYFRRKKIRRYEVTDSYGHIRNKKPFFLIFLSLIKDVVERTMMHVSWKNYKRRISLSGI
jgi:hypothetical protein